MNITVWGGAGFLGSHVCDALSQSGHNVTIADISESKWKTKDQLMIVGDILDKTLVKKSIKGADYVFNFAGIADIDDANNNIELSSKINILGNINLLNECIDVGVKRYLFASSLYVYSESGGFYRCSKQACEDYIQEYHKQYNLDYTILRFGSLYGLRTDEKNAIYRFLNEAVKFKKVNYLGDPNALREYIHAEDAGRICAEMLQQQYKNENIIVTGHQSLRINQLFEMINEIMGGDIQFNFSGEIENSHYKITPYKFKNKLAKKYSPDIHVSMGDGILQILDEIKVK